MNVTYHVHIVLKLIGVSFGLGSQLGVNSIVPSTIWCHMDHHL